MISLSVPLHPDWTGALSVAAYIERVRSLGVHAVELQLPPTLRAADVPRWSSTIETVLQHQLQLAFHLPLSVDHPDWSTLTNWIGSVAERAPLLAIIHGVTAAQADPQLTERTIAHVHHLRAALPDAVTLVVEQGWNWGAMTNLRASFQRMRQRQQQRRLQGGRPTGVGSGMGAAPVPSQVVLDHASDPPDQFVRRSWLQQLRRDGGFSGTATRAATLQVVEQIGQPACVIGWDLAHDWLGAQYGGVTDWTTLPDAAFLDRVGYVRVHDVDERGCDHQPLVFGNVPYATQLRALIHTQFQGTVCVATHYTQQVLRYGSRWHLLERSLAVTRQALRLPPQQ